MMALRHAAQDRVVTNENINSKLNNVKNALVQEQSKGLQKRAALGDLGNKLVNNTTKSNNNAILKKPGIMGPPQKASTKINEILPIKRKQLPKKETHKPEATLKREESILKNMCPPKENTAHMKEESRSYSMAQLTIIDPDANTKDEPQMVTEYLSDIFSYLRYLECEFSIEPEFLDGHKSTPKMRAILVNWLSEVQVNFKVCLETLHLCVSIVDRYLQVNKNVGSSTLQLIGASALFIACKYEELISPSIDDFVYICDDTFTKRQILQTEMKILISLDFNFGKPLSIYFLRRYSKIAAAESRQHTLGKYILEQALLDHKFSSVRPSIQAAAACCLSIAVLTEVMDPSKVWTPTLEHYTTHKYSDFKDVLVQFAYMISQAETSKYQNIRKKYSSASFSTISLNYKLKGPLIRKLTSSPSGTKKTVT